MSRRRTITDPCKQLIVLVGLLLLVGQATAQRKYYEFNNPEALRLNKKRLALLTSTEWACKQLDVYVRGEKATYQSVEKIIYRPDGTYSCRFLTGTWKVQYNRYLVHSASVDVIKGDRPVLGIYGITELNDSILVMTKLQSSSGDMVRKLTFQKGIDQLYQPVKQLYEPFKVVGGTIPIPGRKAASFDIFRKVFEVDEPVNFYVVPQRDNVSTDELDAIDSLALSFVKRHAGDHRGRLTIRSLKPYFRQYVGYTDKAGHRIICLNALLTYHSNWEKDLITPSSSASVEGFRIFVNLTSQECFGLVMYDD